MGFSVIQNISANAVLRHGHIIKRNSRGLGEIDDQIPFWEYARLKYLPIEYTLIMYIKTKRIVLYIFLYKYLVDIKKFIIFISLNF